MVPGAVFCFVYTPLGERLHGRAVKTAKTCVAVIVGSFCISAIYYTTTPPTWGVVDFRKMRKMRDKKENEAACLLRMSTVVTGWRRFLMSREASAALLAYAIISGFIRKSMRLTYEIQFVSVERLYSVNDHQFPERIGNPLQAMRLPFRRRRTNGTPGKSTGLCEWSLRAHGGGQSLIPKKVHYHSFMGSCRPSTAVWTFPPPMRGRPVRLRSRRG